MIFPALTPEELAHERHVNAIMERNVEAWCQQRRHARAAATVAVVVPKVLTELEATRKKLEELQVKIDKMEAEAVTIVPPVQPAPTPARKPIWRDRPGAHYRGSGPRHDR
jgi:hypothetical protein